MMKETMRSIVLVALLCMPSMLLAQEENENIPEDTSTEFISNPESFHQTPVLIHKSHIEFLGQPHTIRVDKEANLLTLSLTLDGDKYPAAIKSIDIDKLSGVIQVNGVVLTDVEDGKASFKLVGMGEKQKSSKTTITFEF